MKKNIWFGLLTIYLIWGSTYLAIRFAIDSIPPFLMASFRFVIAGTILFIWRWLAGDVRPTKRQIFWASIVGLFLIVGGNGSVTWAEQRIVSSVAALIIGTEPLWIVLIDLFNPRIPKPDIKSILGVVVGFIGVVFLLSPSWLSIGIQNIDLVGASVGMLAAFFWAIGSIIARDADLPESQFLSTSIEMLVGSVVLLIFGTLSGEWSRLDLSAITVKSLMGFGYLIVFGSLIAFSVYLWLLRSAPTSLVMTYAYVTPIVAIFLGFFLGGEEITWQILISASLIVGSVIITNASNKKAKAIETSAVPSGSLGDD
jgi:drug/metabolite transporter (DMT)-like permease